jgi:hypothetical protein
MISENLSDAGGKKNFSYLGSYNASNLLQDIPERTILKQFTYVRHNNKNQF